MTEITINPAYILAATYAVVKGFISVWICKREFQYPIWNSDGLQIPRGIQHKLQSFLRNWAINPEWGLIKAAAFAPVFLVTGKRFIHSFMPWRVQKTPPFCKECNDKGKYFVRSSFCNDGGHWQGCSCQRVQVPQETATCSCPVCLDQRTIGKNRSCPHCDRRGKFVLHAKAEVKRSKIEHPEPCQGCGDEVDIRTMKLIDKCFFCPACLRNVKPEPKPEYVKPVEYTHTFIRREIGLSDLSYSRPGRPYDKSIAGNIAPKPHRYLETPDLFCGDPHNEKECDNWRNRHWLKKKQPTELHVGDTILIRSTQTGHRDGSLMGKPLRILGLNLPFAVVEFDASGGRHINTVNLQGMTIYGERDDSAIKSMLAYQPLLDPTALRRGDTFVLLNIRENGTDGSWRGEAFRVTKPVFQLTAADTSSSYFPSYLPEDALVLECEHLSFHRQWDTPTLMDCEKLMIIPVNDQYIQATKSHRPDIGYA